MMKGSFGMLHALRPLRALEGVWGPAKERQRFGRNHDPGLGSRRPFPAHAKVRNHRGPSRRDRIDYSTSHSTSFEESLHRQIRPEQAEHSDDER